MKVVGGDEAVASAGTRDTDYSPFDAGGYMIGPNGTTCSSGFAIRYMGGPYTTTARHCTESSYHDRAASNSYGSTYLIDNSGGARVLLGAGSGRMFDHAYNDASGYDKTVIGFYDVGINDYVCTSGGNSGVHCNIQVDNMLAGWDDGFGTLTTIHGSQRISGAIANMQGDSGGPVLFPTGATTGQVEAVGMIQAVNQYVSNCGSAYDGGSNKCGTGVFFTSMRTIVNSISGASLVTG